MRRMKTSRDPRPEARRGQTRTRRGWVWAACLAVAWAMAGCEPELDDDTPEGALTRFLEAMDRSSRDSASLREAYQLLDAAARAELAARAERAGSLSGQELAPWEMLAQGRFRLRFAPARGNGMRAEIQGDEAVVHVRGQGGQESAQVPMRREKDGWRVVLAVPAIASRGRPPSQ